MFRLPAALLTAISRSDIIRGSAPDAQACTSVPGQELAAFFSRGNRLPLHPSEHEPPDGDDEQDHDRHADAADGGSGRRRRTYAQLRLAGTEYFRS